MGRRAERPSGAPRRESSWLAALLAASILNSCCLLTQAQGVKWATRIPVTWEPLHPLEGKSITLTPGGSLSFLFCNWYRGNQVDAAQRILMYLPSPEQRNGPAQTGRETGGPNCSLHIRRLTPEDTGNYTVSKALSGASAEIGGARITVLGSRALDKGVVAGIAIGAMSMAVLIGLLLHCALCGWCCSSRCGVQRRRFSLRPHDVAPRRHTV